MARRKTIDIDYLRSKANDALANKDNSREYKTAVCDMIQSVLHKTDNYRGFMFIDNEDKEFDSYGYWSRRYF